MFEAIAVATIVLAVLVNLGLILFVDWRHPEAVEGGRLDVRQP